ncbi:hypothetical protein XENOCAPTIV_020149 [Xenoophorus captivus]|uniref:Uncharacterized protein n=1 Tax=Xenoophorus captivus TaxID=1517983 RepID=A0ABV0RCV3_9TELE
MDRCLLVNMRQVMCPFEQQRGSDYAENIVSTLAVGTDFPSGLLSYIRFFSALPVRKLNNPRSNNGSVLTGCNILATRSCCCNARGFFSFLHFSPPATAFKMQ